MTPSRCKYARAKYKKRPADKAILKTQPIIWLQPTGKITTHSCTGVTKVLLCHRLKTKHHTVTQCDQCCKGDTSSQWERAKLPLSTHPHPLTDSHQILHVITSTISAHMPHLVKIALGVISPHIAKVTTQIFKNFFLSLYAKSFNRPGG